MKQVVRRVIDRKGRVRVVEVPEPLADANQILVRTHYSLISSGTEMSTLGKTPLELARQTLADPWMRHVVKQTVSATGIGQTTGRIWNEMIRPREIGYSGCGRVLEVGDGAEGLQVGAKVAFAAAGHAELVAPHLNHVVAVQESIDCRHAAFVTMGGIAVHALRRGDIQFGETVAVYGLGLLGQICARVAKAAGCVVIGIDVNDRRTELAARGGADLVLNPGRSDVQRSIMDFTAKHGADATVICASSKSSGVINSSMEITRKQGRVVIVGYVKLDIHPKNFLLQEIDLRYSRAYGPGSYHSPYEKGRVDYPFGYVRWTEKRNLEEFVRLIATKAIDLEPLIGGSYPVERAQDAFEAIASGSLGGVAALIEYDTEKQPDRRRNVPLRSHGKTRGKIGIAIIGCGNHVLGKHLPNLRRMPEVEIRGIASATGMNASVVAERVGASMITTDVDDLLEDPDVDGILICSTQPSHYEHIRRAIKAGKAIYVEKPLVTLAEDFQDIVRIMDESPVLLTVGLNRRYSPLIRKLREVIQGPIDSVVYLVTQPYTPADHWTLDEIEGGGRLITEGEHFIDLCNLLIGRPPVAVAARSLGGAPQDLRKLCNFALTIYYEDAVAQIVFSESGIADFPREQVTALAKGQVAVIEDFRRLEVYAKKHRTYGRGWGKEMGHREAIAEFVAALRGEPNDLLPWEEASLATRCMFAAQESIRSGELVDLRCSAAATEAG